MRDMRTSCDKSGLKEEGCASMVSARGRGGEGEAPGARYRAVPGRGLNEDEVIREPLVPVSARRVLF